MAKFSLFNKSIVYSIYIVNIFFYSSVKSTKSKSRRAQAATAVKKAKKVAAAVKKKAVSTPAKKYNYK